MTQNDDYSDIIGKVSCKLGNETLTVTHMDRDIGLTISNQDGIPRLCLVHPDVQRSRKTAGDMPSDIVEFYYKMFDRYAHRFRNEGAQGLKDTILITSLHREFYGVGPASDDRMREFCGFS